MIKEDYVSFEVAKLLKEKGFPQSTFRCHYIIDGNSHYKSFENRCGFGDNDIIAPTLVMAMKWLREVHKLYIEITPSSKTNKFIVDSYRIDIVTKRFDTLYVSSGYDIYEDACEAAIKYCLDNIIK